MKRFDTQNKKCKRAKHNETLYIPTVLQAESLAFCSQIPPSFLKHSAEVIFKTAPRCAITVNGSSLSFTTADITSPTHISVQMTVQLQQCVLPCQTTTTKSIDSSELLMVTKSLRKKDVVFIYFNIDDNTIGFVTETANHVKNSLLNACASQIVDVVSLPHNQSVDIPSAVFQRMLRDYRSTTKKIKISGNNTYCMFEIEQSNSLHRTDKMNFVICFLVFLFSSSQSADSVQIVYACFYGHDRFYRNVLLPVQMMIVLFFFCCQTNQYYTIASLFRCMP